MMNKVWYVNEYIYNVEDYNWFNYQSYIDNMTYQWETFAEATYEVEGEKYGLASIRTLYQTENLGKAEKMANLNKANLPYGFNQEKKCFQLSQIVVEDENRHKQYMVFCDIPYAPEDRVRVTLVEYVKIEMYSQLRNPWKEPKNTEDIFDFNSVLCWLNNLSHFGKRILGGLDFDLLGRYLYDPDTQKELLILAVEEMADIDVLWGSSIVDDAKIDVAKAVRKNEPEHEIMSHMSSIANYVMHRVLFDDYLPFLDALTVHEIRQISKNIATRYIKEIEKREKWQMAIA